MYVLKSIYTQIWENIPRGQLKHINEKRLTNSCKKTTVDKILHENLKLCNYESSFSEWHLYAKNYFCFEPISFFSEWQIYNDKTTRTYRWKQ